jgi:hypothetical protein
MKWVRMASTLAGIDVLVVASPMVAGHNGTTKREPLAVCKPSSVIKSASAHQASDQRLIF